MHDLVQRVPLARGQASQQPLGLAPGRRDTTAHSRAVSRLTAATEGARGCARHTHVRYDQ